METQPPPARIRLAIIGGGIAGVALASTLGKFAPKIEVALFESASQFTEIGAGVTIYGRTFQVISALGLTEPLKKITVSPNWQTEEIFMRFRKSDQPIGQDYSKVSYGHGQGFHRADFLDLLTQGLPPSVSLHFGKRLVSYEQSPGQPITMHFKDGTTAVCDALVGCDGIRSQVRENLVEQYALEVDASDKEYAEKLRQHRYPRWSGTYLTRGLAPASCIPPQNWKEYRMSYNGKNKHLVVYPINGNTLLTWGTYITDLEKAGTPWTKPWVQDTDPSEVIPLFEGWEPEVQMLLKGVKTASTWAIHTVSMPFYSRGHVAVIGDAAHAVEPHRGAGANQAIEDAYMLGRILGDPSVTVETLPSAFAAYEHVRRPRIERIARISNRMGLLSQFNAGADDNLEELGRESASPENLLPFVSGQVEDDVQKGLEFLRALH